MPDRSVADVGQWSAVWPTNDACKKAMRRQPHGIDAPTVRSIGGLLHRSPGCTACHGSARDSTALPQQP